MLILSSWIFGFSDVGGAAVAVPMVVAALAIAQSLITDWELSIANVMPLPMHLTMDVIAGVVLAASPFVFGFSDEGANAWIPHVVAGVGLIGAGLMTERTRETPRTAQDAGWGSSALDCIVRRRRPAGSLERARPTGCPPRPG